MTEDEFRNAAKAAGKYVLIGVAVVAALIGICLGFVFLAVVLDVLFEILKFLNDLEIHIPHGGSE